ncbi:MAG: hypothetical protein DI547_09730 [Sphingobium sp.]|nr:MAG: hypothetical protein DI547_09730 [Sphingobium sp.]
MRTWIMLATAFGLASCGGDGGETTSAPVNQAEPESGAAAQVAKLDETARNGVLEKAIRASGAACPTVTSSERTEIRTGVKGWRAHCDDGTQHLIEIRADGTANVTSRTH